MILNIKEIKTLNYKRPVIEKGYTNQYLDINLSTATVVVEPIPEKMKETFIGGKGFDLWLL